MIVHKDLPSFNNRTPVQLKKVMNAVIDLILKIGKSGLSISASALRSVSKSLSASKQNRVSSDSYTLLIIRETSVIFTCFYARLFVCSVNNVAYGTLYFSRST